MNNDLIKQNSYRKTGGLKKEKITKLARKNKSEGEKKMSRTAIIIRTTNTSVVVVVCGGSWTFDIFLFLFYHLLISPRFPACVYLRNVSQLHTFVSTLVSVLQFSFSRHCEGLSCSVAVLSGSSEFYVTVYSGHSCPPLTLRRQCLLVPSEGTVLSLCDKCNHSSDRATKSSRHPLLGKSGCTVGAANLCP